MRSARLGSPCLVVVLVFAAVLAGCSGGPPPAAGCGTFGVYVDAFPTPVSDATTLFPDVDDAYLAVAFASGFRFPFYGTNYSSVYLNTNGGMTFGGGISWYDVAADEVDKPTIAVFWGDMDAGEYGGVTRANQMRWRKSSTCFQVAYVQFQDNDEPAWNNTATVTLHADGKIVVEYGTVLSEDILVGVFDGSHVNDAYLAVASSFDLSDHGSGVILFDYFGAGPEHDGELDGKTITYRP